MALVKQASREPMVAEGALVKMSKLGDWTSIGRDSRVMSSVIGSHCDIEERNLVQKSTIGDMTYTGADTSIMWAEVGKWCCISRLVDIGGNEHNYRATSMMPDYRVKTCLEGKLARHHEEEVIRVGNDVWIGQGAAIARKPGLTVGDGAVIGTGAVVTKSVPSYAVVAGVPARVIRYRFDEPLIAALCEMRWWDWPEEAIKANWDLLSQDLDVNILAELQERAEEL